MKNYCNLLGALAAVSALTSGNASAEIAYTLHTGYSNEYLWRGLNLGNDLVEAGADVAGKAYGLDLSAGAWYGSFSKDGTNSNELDLYGEVARDFGFVKGSIGYIAYTYPNSTSSTYEEVYFGLARTIGYVDTSLKYFWGVKGDNNGYTELGLGHSFTLSPCLSLGLTTNVGYQIEKGQATAWTSKVSLDWGFAEHAKLSPFVSLAVPMSDDNDTAYFHSGNELVAGTMLSVTF